MMNSTPLDHQNTVTGTALAQKWGITYFVRTQGYVTTSHKMFSPPPRQPQRQDAIDFLTRWLKEGQQPYCALMGEYGTGKTTVCKMLFELLIEKHRLNKNSPVPVYLDLRHLNGDINNISLTSIIDNILQKSIHPIHLNATEAIRLAQEGNALIIFDGLDEILIHLSPVEGQQFTRKLLSILSLNSVHNKVTKGRILLTCRDHFFRTLREQKSHFTTEDRGNITAEDYSIFILLPLVKSQIYEYLQHTLPNKNTNNFLDSIKSIQSLSELMERPYTLSLLSKIIPQIEIWNKEGVKINIIKIYQHIILSCLERDTGKHILSINHKQLLMEYLAAELWRSGQKLWDINDIENWFVHFIYSRHDIAKDYISNQDDNSLYRLIEEMKEDLRTATFLIRLGERDFCFAHTSLQEFFLAIYLRRALVENNIEQWNMPLVSHETLEFLGQLLEELNSNDRETALQTLCTICDCYRPYISELGFSYLLFAHNHNYLTVPLNNIKLDGANLKGWNIIGTTSNTETSSINLKNASFRGTHLEGANLRNLNLEHADLSDAYLDDIEITLCNAAHTRFNNAHLIGAFFKQVNLENAYFINTHTIDQVQWLECTLHNTKGLVNVPAVLFSECEPQEAFSKIPSLTSHHSNAIENCHFSSDGQLIVSASWDKTIRLWDFNSQKCIRIIQDNIMLRKCLFSPNGKYLASVGIDPSIKIWDIETSQCIKLLTGHKNWIRDCSFSLDGKKMATASEDKTVRIWDVETSQCLHILSGHHDWVRSCTFSPDGSIIASASEDHTLRTWNTNTGHLLTIFTGHTEWVRSCSFSFDGQFLASASGDKTIRIWQVNTGECIQLIDKNNARIRVCTFAPHQLWLASGGDDYIVRIWDIVTGSCLMELTGHKGKIRGCSFSNNGKYLVSCSEDKTLRLWETSTGKLIKIL